MYMWRHLPSATSLLSALAWSSITYLPHFNSQFTSSTLTLWFKTIFNGGCYWEGLSFLSAVMESRDPFFEVSVSVLKVSGLVSVSKDFGLGLELFVSRLCIGYLLWSFARSSLKKRFYKINVQNLAVQSLKFILNSIKNMHAPMTPQRVISATRGWEYFAKDYLWTVFPRVLF